MSAPRVVRRSRPELPPEVIAEIVERAAAIVLDRLLGALRPVSPPVYSTRKGQGPPGYADREWKRLARTIGVRRGRWWYVGAAELQAFERGGAPVPAPATSSARAIANDGAWTPDDTLRELGFRSTRRGGGR